MKQTPRQLIAAFLLLATLPNCQAQQPAPKAAPVQTNAAPFKITISRDTDEGRVLGHRPVITFQGIKYTAIFPASYRIRSSEEQKRVVGYRPDNSCSITLAFWPAAKLGQDQKFNHDFLRWWIEEQSNDGRITGETWRSALGRQAPTFDVTWKTESGVLQMTRIVFVSLPDAIIEVSIMSNLDSFQNNSFAHADLLGSLRKSDKDGKLEINPLSSKF
jgi:hypothetical protein